MGLAIEILTAATLIAGPGPTSVPMVDPCRILPARAERARGGALRLAVALGASWAWDLADLPRRNPRLPEPIGGFPGGASFRRIDPNGFAVDGRPDDAITALITRWNQLYPAYAFDRTRL